MILHVRRDITDYLNMISVANELVGDSKHRLKVIGSFNTFLSKNTINLVICKTVKIL